MHNYMQVTLIQTLSITLGKYHVKKTGTTQIDLADANQLNSQSNHKAAQPRFMVHLEGLTGKCTLA